MLGGGGYHHDRVPKPGQGLKPQRGQLPPDALAVRIPLAASHATHARQPKSSGKDHQYRGKWALSTRGEEIRMPVLWGVNRLLPLEGEEPV
jgi:hypothetical protein